jgi:hypothetical protein
MSSLLNNMAFNNQPMPAHHMPLQFCYLSLGKNTSSQAYFQSIVKQFTQAFRHKALFYWLVREILIACG